MLLTTLDNQQKHRLEYIYSKKVLESASLNLQWAKYAVKEKLPSHAGTDTVRFWGRKTEADINRIHKAAEGELLKDFDKSAELKSIDVKLEKYRTSRCHSDIMSATDMFRMLDMDVDVIGEDAALHLDTQIRDAVIKSNLVEEVSGTHKFYAGNFKDFGKLKESDPRKGKLTMADLLRSKTRLDLSHARKFGNSKGYIALVSPKAAHDLLQDEAWEKVHQYQDKEAIYEGELGKYMGITIIECDNFQTENDQEGVFDQKGDIQTAVIFGKDSFGTVDLESGSGKTGKFSSPWAPRITYLDNAEKSDSDNSLTIITWKAFYASCVLDPKHIVTIRHKSTFE